MSLGSIDYTENIVRGVTWVGTPSHGGLRIARKWFDILVTGGKKYHITITEI